MIQSGLVAIDVLVGNVHRIHIKFQLFCVNLSAEDGFYIVQYIGQIDLGFLQLHFSAFDAAHIQDVIDKRKQVVAGGKNLGKIILYTLLVVQMAGRQGGKADDGVHRGANIVGHTGKEGALGTVGVFGGGNGIRKCPVQLLVGSAVR